MHADAADTPRVTQCMPRPRRGGTQHLETQSLLHAAAIHNGRSPHARRRQSHARTAAGFPHLSVIAMQCLSNARKVRYLFLMHGLIRMHGSAPHAPRLRVLAGACVALDTDWPAPAVRRSARVSEVYSVCPRSQTRVQNPRHFPALLRSGRGSHICVSFGESGLSGRGDRIAH